MQQNNLNKNIAQQLNELETMPEGIQFNSNRAWQKIEESLHPKQKKIIGWWYVAAAASVLLICSLFFFLSPKNTSKQVADKKEIDKTDLLVKIKTVAATATVNYTSPTKKIVIKEKRIVAFKSIKNKIIIKPVVNVMVLNSLPGGQQVLPGLLITDQKITIANNPKTVSSGLVSVNKKMAKPILKVVHINELGEAIEVVAQEKSKLNTAWFLSKKNYLPNDSDPFVSPSKKSLFIISLNSTNNN